MSLRFTQPNFENASLSDLHEAMNAGMGETRLRCMAIIMLGTGSAREQVMLACNVTDRALRKWISLFNKNGIDGLIVRKRSGRPKKISPDMTNKIRCDIQNPKSAGKDFWTAKAFHGYLREKYNIECCYSTVVNLFHKEGFSLKVPRPWPDRQDDILREEFIQKMKPLLNNPDVELWFADESGINGEPKPRAVWTPNGVRPKVIRNGDHVRLSILGVVCPRTGEFFAIEASHTDGEVFQAFLDETNKCVKPTRKRNILILDNASWHKSKKLNWHFFEPMYLPPYSPDLNPIERLWLVLKSNWFCNIHCKSREILSERICRAICDLIDNPQQVAKTTKINF